MSDPRTLNASIIAPVGESWTRDPFDRMITAHAHLTSAPLLTKDDSIRQHYQHGSYEWIDQRSLVLDRLLADKLATI